MNKFTSEYCRFLIITFALSPFLAAIAIGFLKIDFARVMQLFTYLGIILLLIFRDKKKQLVFPNYLLFYFFFILYVFFADLYLLDRKFKVMYLFSNSLIGAFNLMFIIENLEISQQFYKRILKISKNILIVATIVIIIQQVVDPNFFVYSHQNSENIVFESNSNEDRLMSIYSWLGPLSLGFGFIPIFLIVVEELYNQKEKILVWILMGIFVAFLTKGRWVLVNSLLVIFILIANNQNKIFKLLKIIFILPIIILFSYIILNFLGVDSYGIWKTRILESDKSNISQKSAGTRILAFEAFNRFFWDQPILGTGDIKYGMGGTNENEYKLRSFLKERSSQLHVGYLALLYRYGLVGGFLFLSFLWLLMRKLYRDAKKTRMWSPFLAIIGFALANLTLVTFSLFQMGLIIALFANQYYCQKQTLIYSQDQ